MVTFTPDTCIPPPPWWMWTNLQAWSTYTGCAGIEATHLRVQPSRASRNNTGGERLPVPGPKEQQRRAALPLLVLLALEPSPGRERDSPAVPEAEGTDVRELADVTVLTLLCASTGWQTLSLRGEAAGARGGGLPLVGVGCTCTASRG